MAKIVPPTVDPRIAQIGDFNVRSYAGSPAAQGLRGLSEALSRLDVLVRREQAEEQMRARREELANRKVAADPTPLLMEIEEQAAPDGSDLYQRTRDGWYAWMETQTQDIADDEVRVQLHEYLAGRMVSSLSGVAVRARELRRNEAEQQFSQALNALTNQVRLDPSAYEDRLAVGLESLAAHPELDSTAAQSALRQQLIASRFAGRIEQASNPDVLDSILIEIEQGDWYQQLTPKTFSDIREDILARRASLRRRHNGAAHAAVQSIERMNDELLPVTPELFGAAQEQVALSGHAAHEDRLARASRNQQLLRRFLGRNPEEIRLSASRLRSDYIDASRLDARVKGAIVAAANDVAGVPLSFLLGTVQLESGGGKDYAVKAKTSSASGIFQFTDQTWLNLLERYGPALGATAGMTREQQLALRNQPESAAKGAALLARENGRILQRRLGREINDLDLYFAHFLGAGAAARFLTHVTTHDDVAAAPLLPDAAEANRSVFYARDGTARTVQEVHDFMAERLASVHERYALGDVQFLERMADKVGDALKKTLLDGRDLQDCSRSHHYPTACGNAATSCRRWPASWACRSPTSHRSSRMRSTISARPSSTVRSPIA